MSLDLTEIVGITAGVLTTLCWLPQVAKMLRARSAKDLSLVTQVGFTLGVLLWLVYGLLLGRPAIVLANGITLTLALAVLALKLRFG
jgi:MtN3 and saliva related transmembrane protein